MKWRFQIARFVCAQKKNFRNEGASRRQIFGHRFRAISIRTLTSVILIGLIFTDVTRYFLPENIANVFSVEPAAAAAELTQTHYHWRNNDGNETSASSATDGAEDTPIAEIPKETIQRLRIQVSNEGDTTSTSSVYRLEYGAKIATCAAVGVWTDVGAVGGAFDMATSTTIADGNTTNFSSASLGAISDENTSFVGTGALRETSSESGSITLDSDQFTELEYSIMTTNDMAHETTYCFRVSMDGTALSAYTTYPELTTSEKQDFFVQRGNTVISGTNETLTAGIDYIAPASTSRAFVRITNSQLTGAGNGSGSTNQTANNVTAYISEQSDLTDSFTLSRAATTTTDTRVSWEILEFVGMAGTDNEMIVRDSGELSFSTNTFEADGTTVANVADDNDIVVFITGQQNSEATTNNYNDGLFTADWDAANDRPVFQRGDADTTAAVSYAIIEFIGPNWNVERIEHVYAAAGTVETESMTAIPAVNRGFVHAQKSVGEGEGGLDAIGHQVWISSLGAVSFQLRDTVSSPSEHTSVAWVVSNNQTTDGAMSVYQSSGTLSSSLSTAEVTSIHMGATLNIKNSSIFATNDSAGTNTFFPQVQNSFYIASSTHYEIWRSVANEPIDFRVEVVKWPAAETTVHQNYYRFYADNDTVDPTDPWPVGAADLGENTSITEDDEPLGELEIAHLRMSLQVMGASLPENTTAFKLQYGTQSTTCSAVSVWNDVGSPGSGAIWRGYDATPADGSLINNLNLSVSDVAGTYEEENNSAVNPNAVAVGDDIEYDWVIQHNGAAQQTDYCFRVVYADGTLLDGYNNYPTLRTTKYTPVIGDWRWYDDEENETPTTALAAENVAPINIENQQIIKLRVAVPEVENSTGSNVKLSLQFSQYADFRDGGTTMTSIADCTATSTWCYADGGGTDNAILNTAVINSTDSCVAGAGTGCGTHNETATASSTLTHLAGTTMEYEFTVRQAGARVNGVYYFRLFDEGFNEALTASSSYPSLVTEGATFNLSVGGLPTDTTTGGIVTDATTTATNVALTNIPIGNPIEAAQRISVITNATEGYQVLKYASQQLTNSYGDTIPAITGNNLAPLGWDTACQSNITSCFGYHTTDATLAGGSARFAPIDSYAALSTTAEEIMYSSIPVAGTEDVIYRIEITENQPPGEYLTNIIYIGVPVH